MGLDIHIAANNHDDIRLDVNYDRDFFSKYSLSRTFCNFMCRKNVVSSEPELDQIGCIAGVDISPLYAMEEYPDPENMDVSFSFARSEEERQNMLAKAEKDKKRLTGNIDTVILTVANLMEKLQSIDHLPELLESTDYDTLHNQSYFSDFQMDKGDGYIGNNFGQDLRNFKRFLDYAKSKGTSTVWFNYG